MIGRDRLSGSVMSVWKYSLGLLLSLAVCAVGASDSAHDEEDPSVGATIPLYKGKETVHVMHRGRAVRVKRVQDRDYELNGYFAKTSRECPPFCLGAIEVDPQVKTVGEVEVLKFMETKVRDGEGMLVDARTPSWHSKGTIPSSINIPFTQLSKGINEPEMIEAMKRFGAKPRKNKGGMMRAFEEIGLIDGKYKTTDWDFTESKELILWCNGPACGQSPRAIKGLLKAGYPADKVFYYRGGMQVWLLFGLTTVLPEG